jgi:hypothetical protein
VSSFDSNDCFIFLFYTLSPVTRDHLFALTSLLIKLGLQKSHEIKLFNRLRNGWLHTVRVVFWWGNGGQVGFTWFFAWFKAQPQYLSCFGW